jgi:hypothetical protein
MPLFQLLFSPVQLRQRSPLLLNHRKNSYWSKELSASLSCSQ